MQNQPSSHSEVKYCKVNLTANFPIVCMHTDHWYTSEQAVTMVHFHNCLQIGYCYDGRGYSLIDGVLYPYDAGDISIIPAKIEHHCTSQPNTVSRWKWLYLDLVGLLPYLHPDLTKSLLPMIYGKTDLPYTMNEKDNLECVLIVRTIACEMENARDGYRDIVRNLIQALMEILLRYSLQPRQENGREASVQTGLQIIAPAIEHISMYYMHPLTIPQLAKLCHISTTHLRRMFVKIMDCSPLDYLQLIRMQAACALLLLPDTSVTEAGSRVGFPTATSFTRQFKKILHTTPGQWRKNMMNKHKSASVELL